MDRSTCRVDCSLQPTELLPNPDIDGPGIGLAYTLTAGLALLTVIVHYIFTYNPEIDPFTTENSGDIVSQYPHFVPNHMDVCILSGLRVRSLKRYFNTRRIHKASISYMLTISDLQLWTGLATLVSGYSQLPCGLSSFHWQKLLYLAWFASFTHLSCLTFLRSYLYHHPSKRVWRLVCLTALVIMLAVGLVPTGHFAFPYENIVRPSRADPAVCFFKAPQILPSYVDFVSDFDIFSTSQQFMVISICFLVFGLTFRIIRIHRVSSEFMANSRRIYANQSQKMLFKLRIWGTKSELIHVTVFRPILSLFLVLTTLVDFWCSMTFEVAWLFAGFVWGVLRLYVNVRIRPGWQEQNEHIWSFGQVLPLVLLLVPVVAMAEALYPDTGSTSMRASANHTHASTTTTTPSPAEPQATNPAATRTATTRHHDSEYNIYESTFIRAYKNIFLIATLCMIIAVLFLPPLNGSILLFIMPNKQGWSLPLNVFLGLFFTVLFSLLFEQWSTYNTLPNWLLQAFRHFIYFLILTLYLGMGFVSSAWFSIFRHNMYDAPLLFFSPILVSISVGVYLVLCAVDAYWLDPGMGREVETRAEDTEV